VTEAALAAHGLVRTYAARRWPRRGVADVHAVADVSLSVASGETLGLVGESGCGKSTLARLLCLVESPDAGRLEVEGVDPATLSPSEKRALHRKVQLVFQNPYAALNPRHTVATILEEPLRIQGGYAAAERADKVAAVAEAVGLPPQAMRRFPHMFSGGQRQRIAIARALVLDPRVLVADEPVSALDLSVQAQILNLFLDIRERSGVACVFVSHDLAVVRHVAQRVAVMYLGRLVEVGAAGRVLAAPAHPYTRALVASTPRLGVRAGGERAALRGEPASAADVPPGCAFHPRCPWADDRCRTERPLLRVVEERTVACHHAERLG